MALTAPKIGFSFAASVLIDMKEGGIRASTSPPNPPVIPFIKGGAWHGRED